MADVSDAVDVGGALPKKRTFRKFSYRGVDLEQLLDMGTDELVKLFPARARRRFQRGLKRKPMALIKKLRKAKRDAPAGEKPEPVRTHLRNMIIVPEMIGSIIGVYNGKTFNQVEIKPEMIGHYLAEFSISYKPVLRSRSPMETPTSSSATRGDASVSSILSTAKRDFLISPLGEKVPLKELEGVTIGLYFAANWFAKCAKFTSTLAKIYWNLKEHGAKFEVVFVSCDEDQSSFEHFHGTMPWLAIPYGDLQSKKTLNNKYHIEGIPSLVILSSSGELLQADGVDLIHRYGSRAFPFTPLRIRELEAEEKAKHDSQTLVKLLSTNDRGYVIDQGKQVPILNLKGKTIGLYFSAQWCPPCAKFTSRLASFYRNLREKHDQFEIVFISLDRDASGYSDCYSEMPWFALPFDVESTKRLCRYFDIQGIPTLVIIGPDGKTLTKEGRNMINLHMEMAYPFTEKQMKLLREKMDEEAKSYPASFNHVGHRHMVYLVSENSGGGPFICCECGEQGSGWAYQCLGCGYEIHLKCVRELQGNGASKIKEPSGDTFCAFSSSGI